jgi:hypothetical protein
MLIALADVKSYLGIDNLDTTYDSFLTEQEEIVSSSIENYCGRKFLSATYTQVFYLEDFDYRPKVIHTFHYPLVSVTSVKEYPTKLTDTAVTLLAADYRVQKPYGVVTSSTNNFFLEGNILEIVYVAGYAALPAPIKSVELSILEERYNKKKSGISLNFGSDVQRVSIAGTISVDFDYSLQSNERVSAYGTILGNYINVLDQYRSERVLTGSGMITYVS